MPRTSPVTDPLAAGRDALGRGEWGEARAFFEDAVEQEESPEAVEALAMSAWWLDDARLTIESRERAYRLYRERGNAAAAARMSIWLAWDSMAFRSEPAVASGWLQRAHSLLDGIEPAPEHGWLAIREGEFAFVLENDLAKTRRLARRARAIGSSLGVPDIEISALALEGLALASEGKAADGIRRLDEASAAAVAGEISELWAVGRTCCYVITACERVRDFDRASQWCERMLEFAARWRIRDLFAVCKAHYAAILVSRGTWDEAEEAFATSMREFAGTRPGMMFEAVVRLAELRRRQGRREEAAALFAEVEFHPWAQLGLAELALDAGDPGLAAERAERFLGKLAAESRLQRVAGLDLLVRARVALDDAAGGRTALTELQELVAAVGTDSLRASALSAEGAVAGAEGDLDTARRRLEDAVDLFRQCGAPFETAHSRLELARVLRGLGREDAAAQQERAADEAMRAMQVERDPSPLTPRELDVVRLVAQGLSNPEIAARLVLSDHTVHRHLANILRKLDLPSRAAVAAWAARSGLA